MFVQSFPKLAVKWSRSVFPLYLDVGDGRQTNLCAGIERDHGEEGGDAEGDASGHCAGLQEEAHPGDGDNEHGGQVRLDQVMAKVADKFEVHFQAGIVA